MEHGLEREQAQLVHHKGLLRQPIAPIYYHSVLSHPDLLYYIFDITHVYMYETCVYMHAQFVTLNWLLGGRRAVYCNLLCS